MGIEDGAPKRFWAKHKVQAVYNQQWHIGRHGYRSPAQVREQQKAEATTAA